MVGGEGQRESAALVLDPWLVTPYLATPVAWSSQVAPEDRGAGGRGLARGANTTSHSRVFPGPDYALQFPVLTETLETGGASGRFAHRIQGKEGVGGGPRSGSVREWNFSGGPGRTAERRPFPWSGRVKGTPGGRGTPKYQVG